jgi:hypothetical protein
MEKVENFLKNRFFHKSFIAHFEAFLMSFLIKETIFLYFEFFIKNLPNMKKVGEIIHQKFIKN